MWKEIKSRTREKVIRDQSRSAIWPVRRVIIEDTDAKWKREADEWADHCRIESENRHR
jgi:hypothetical protein